MQLRHSVYLFLTVSVVSQAAHAQDLDEPRFEVASIRLAPPPDGGTTWTGSSGGPGTKDPTLFRCENCSIASLISTAYDLRPSEFDAPDELKTPGFNVSARVPPGTTKERFRLMLQRLLAERFKLRTHRQSRDAPGYELTAGKSGPKFRPADLSKDISSGPPTHFAVDRDGFPEVPLDYVGMIATNGRARMNQPRMSMDELCKQLAVQLHAPVRDSTGLEGRFHIRMYWLLSYPTAAPTAATEDTSAAGPTLSVAVQEQLGLKLQRTTLAINALVVDSVQKSPSED